jgi:hypothetical protein
MATLAQRWKEAISAVERVMGDINRDELDNALQLFAEVQAEYGDWLAKTDREDPHGEDSPQQKSLQAVLAVNLVSLEVLRERFDEVLENLDRARKLELPRGAPPK